MNQLHDKLESIRNTTLKRAHEAYAQQLEAGMNEMVQVSQQWAQRNEEVKP